MLLIKLVALCKFWFNDMANVLFLINFHIAKTFLHMIGITAIYEFVEIYGNIFLVYLIFILP